MHFHDIKPLLKSHVIRWFPVFCLYFLLACENNEVVNSGDRHPFEEQALDLINQRRAAQGLPQLLFSQTLFNQARQHSITMAESSTLHHIGWEQRVQNIETAFPVFDAAENVGFNFDSSPAERVITQWLSNTSERQNLEKRNFTHCGLAMFQANTGAYFFTAIFVETTL